MFFLAIARIPVSSNLFDSIYDGEQENDLKWSWRYEGVGKEMQSAEGRRFAGSLVVSLAILLTGIAWTMRIGNDCNKIYHQLAHTHEALDGLREVVKTASLPKGHMQ